MADQPLKAVTEHVRLKQEALPILFKIAHSAPAYASTLQKILHRSNDNLPTRITTPIHVFASGAPRQRKDGVRPAESPRSQSLRRAVQRLCLGLLAARAIEHHDLRQPAHGWDRLDELHRFPADGAQGRSGGIG
jgi:hypothetical protein